MEMTTLCVIVTATAGGTPRWPSIHRRRSGPSLRSMNRLKTVNARKKPSDARPLIPTATPWTNVEITSGTDAFRLSVDVDAPD